MFEVEDKIENEGYVIIFSDSDIDYYYDKNWNLKINFDNFQDIMVFEYYPYLLGAIEIFYNFDFSNNMNITSVSGFKLDEDSDIEECYELKFNKRKTNILKKTKIEMFKKYGDTMPKYTLFELPNIKLSTKEICFINMCYGNFISGNRRAYLYSSCISDSDDNKDTFITTGENFKFIKKLVNLKKSYITGVYDYNDEMYYNYVIFEEDKKSINKIKLSVDSDIFDKIRNVNSR